MYCTNELKPVREEMFSSLKMQHTLLFVPLWTVSPNGLCTSSKVASSGVTLLC